MLHIVPLAGCLESVGCEAGAAVGEPVGDPEGQGVECVREEGNGRGRGRVILDGEVHIPGGAVEGDGEGAFAGGAVAVTELGQVLHVDMHEADLVVLESAVRLAGLLGRRRPVETLRLRMRSTASRFRCGRKWLTTKVSAPRGKPVDRRSARTMARSSSLARQGSLWGRAERS